ncbi:MAG: response regulator [Leptolyngbyaceae cyanobacterium SL_7_1]|nr:response regulator [Leptolyngbyaceae cyanobacterium SL_7_1]
MTVPLSSSTTSSLPTTKPFQKPKMLVVDDEPDNLDLLYRTFRRDFEVLRAESGILALEILAAEGEVAVIISDQRMPEMKGTEFLSKTVPQFPNTVRIILTGFTDVEDLVEAINSGQVYKYITKPWDPSELKVVVHRAVEAYELVKQRAEELKRAQAQTALLSAIAQAAKEYLTEDTLLTAIATAFGQTLGRDGCILRLVNGTSLAVGQGIYCSHEGYDPELGAEEWVETAIASQTLQVTLNESTPTHVLVPVCFRAQVLALLSLQWMCPRLVQEEEVALLRVAIPQVALSLACACQDRVPV